jgi:hypothetical protein
LGRVLAGAVTVAPMGRSLAVLRHVSTAIPVIRSAAARRAWASVVEPTVVRTRRPRRTPAVPARRRSGPGPAAGPVRRPHAVMIASAITCIIGPRSIPRGRAGRSTADRRSCVPGLGGLGHLRRSCRGDGAGLAHHLDYARNLVNGNTLSSQSGNELDRRSSLVAILRRRGSTGRSRSRRRRERIRQSRCIYRLARRLGGRQERHIGLCLIRRRDRLHRATTRQATRCTEHGCSGRSRSRSCQAGITLSRRGILPRNARKFVQDDVWNSCACRWCCWFATGTK